MPKNSKAVKKRLLAAILKAERDRDKLRDVADGHANRLAAVIAEDLGIEVGARYKVIPRPGNAYTVTVKSIGGVMPYHPEVSTRLEDLYIGVFVHCERKRGRDVFRSEWVYTNRAEFVRVRD